MVKPSPCLRYSAIAQTGVKTIHRAIASAIAAREPWNRGMDAVFMGLVEEFADAVGVGTDGLDK